ncbi:unnamed protein product [Miscanthus lutarioriparius]|uniref:ABC transporter domain-containing protein n=1 Tax=Miscanthus lutarioriparius TaxID=422564 RepID=A0A811RBK9_9POAL|nr:unnamed protein product [Miscanthus lutarioriparius]
MPKNSCAGGCEIQASGINYRITVSSRPHPPLKVWSRSDDDVHVQDHQDHHHHHSVRHVLRDVSYRARPSELLAIVGPSGAGKSTLLEILAGRLSPSPQHDLLLLDGAAAHSADLRRVSGYVTQQDVPFPLLTVRETLLFSARRYTNSRAREVAVLSQRFFKNVARMRQLFAWHTVCMLVAGLALGSIFYDLGEDKVAERVGLFAFLLTFLLSSTTEALPIFLQERDILAKETSSGAYRVSSYAVANAVVFLPFKLALAVVFAAPVYWLAGLRRTAAAFGYFLLVIWLILYTANSVVVCFAAAAPDFVVGNVAIQGVMGSFFLFSGYFIARSAMPACWVFMHYLSLFKRGILVLPKQT